MTDADPETTYSITDLARAFGVTARTLRFYEEQGLLTPRRKGARRLYSERERVRLLLIVKGRRLGFSLAECRDIIDLYDGEATEAPQLHRLIETIRTRRAAFQAQLQTLHQTLADLDQVEAEAQRLLADKQRPPRP
jgi:DNA-binding transcriptional MerR regulator